MTSVERAVIDREGPLQTLDELLADVRRGRGRAAVISGSVGAGKTELLQTVASRAACAGATVLSAIASRAEQSLPLGVISQLLQSADLAAETAARVAHLLDEGGRSRWDEDRLSPLGQANARVLHGLCLALLELSSESPLVICVDDIHHADLPSQECLWGLVRRLGPARVLVIFTESPQLSPVYRGYYAQLLHNPSVRVIQLPPLSRAEVTGLLSGCLDNPEPQLAAEYHASTGGNPLLLRALLEDSRQPSAGAPYGEAFTRAVLCCLYRCEPATQRVACAVAAVGEAATAGTVSGVLGIDPAVTARAVHLLSGVGLLQDGDFRHPSARAAVLGSMTPEERANLHRRVACLLHGEGAPAAAVARHLVLADRIDVPWALPTLREAAEQALASGEAESAVACLRTAREACPDPRQHAEVTSMLARAMWRIDPARVLPYLPDLVTAFRAGHLHGRHTVAPVNFLLWHGRVDEATEILRSLCSAEALDPETARAVRVTLLWLAYCFPDHTTFVRHQWSALATGNHKLAEGLPLRASSVLTAMADYSPHGDAVATTEPVLQGAHLDETLGPFAVAVSALIFADQVGTATFWRDPLLHEEMVGRVPTWQALLCAIRAEAALGQGDLAGVEANVRRGLATISPKGWGMALGGLLSTAIMAAAAAGNRGAATGYLRIPLPAGLFRTPFGLKYLHARSRYYLAAGEVRAAVSDSQLCGETLATWGLDMSSLVPWRTVLAYAYLKLDLHRKSRELAREQLRRLDEGQLRTRGITLRVLAAASEPARRVPLLREAVELLQVSGDRLQAAHAYADLSNALYEVGDSTRARTILRRAQRMAEQRGVTIALPQPPATAAAADRVPRVTGSAGQVSVAELSEAERRVAALAASGFTNREIARKLYVTVSTVEQHLTRVYRKLGVNRRTDLPPELHDAAAERPATAVKPDLSVEATPVRSAALCEGSGSAA